MLAFATDYDGTLAHHAQVSPRGLEALARLRAAGCRLLLVTGREISDLNRVFPQIDAFDLVVAENGALLVWPERGEERLLCPAADSRLVAALRERQVTPLSVGKAVIATRVPEDQVVRELISRLGLNLQIIYNKGAVMVLPPGVDKQSGLTAALAELQIPSSRVVGVGDAENDQELFAAVGFRAAVENAVDELKAKADWIASRRATEGVIELAEGLLSGAIFPAREPPRKGRARDGDDQDRGPTSVIIG